MLIQHVEQADAEPLEPYLENSSLTDKAWYDFEDYPAGSLSVGD